jgi:hypothetical protein
MGTQNQFSKGENMLNFRASPALGRFVSISSVAIATLSVGLPGVAQAQFSGITQSGTAKAGSTVIDRSPQGMYTNPYSDAAALKDLPSGLQTAATAGVNGASASLTTLVGADEINVSAYAQATNGTKNFYDANGVVNHITQTSSRSSANVDIRFTLGQTTAISVVDNSLPAGKQLWSLATNAPTLSMVDAQGNVVNAFPGPALFGLTSLDAGQYRLQFSVDGLDTGLTWGLSIKAAASAVPEPTLPALWMLGGLMLAGAVRRQKH